MERFIIYNGNYDGNSGETPQAEPLNRPVSESAGVEGKAGTGPKPNQLNTSAAADTDATQVVHISESTGSRSGAPRSTAPQSRPSSGQNVQRSSSAPQRRSSTGANQSAPRPSASRSAKRRRNRTLIIVLSILTVALLCGSLAAVFFLSQPEEDDGLILSNVFAAGVNLSGMTQEDAKNALRNATSDTYTQLDMTVTVLDTTVKLTPSATGADLDINRVVEEAYNYGRTGTKAEQQRVRAQAASTVHVISVIPYLNLDTTYIQNVVQDLGSKYSSTLAQPSYRLEGTAPSFSKDETDTSVVYQTLYIFTGTPEYGLNTNSLYEQIMEAYNTNIWQVAGNCTVTNPETFDLDELYDRYCTAPEDAELDNLTYEVTPETYGYGFDLTAAKEALLNAEYGTTIEIPLCLIEPDILAKDYDKLFRDTLASFSTEFPSGSDLLTNLRKACAEINGTILKVGEEFSFNEAIGQPTVGKGYKYVEIFAGTEYKEVLGGGISQVASTLYYCALMADLDITERTSHTYVTDFIDAGLDAYTQWNVADLRFTNSTNEPLRIDAKIEGNEIVISLIGTDDKSYRIEIEPVTEKTYEPVDLIHLMYPTNAGGYLDGDILVTPITGYDITTYLCKFDKESGSQIAREVVARTHYEKRNALIVEIFVAPEPEPTEPSEPSNPSEPTEPSGSSGSTNPTQPTGSTGSSASTEPSSGTP
ncbi:MAG: VanW family protein [Faecousia sp.]